MPAPSSQRVFSLGLVVAFTAFLGWFALDSWIGFPSVLPALRGVTPARNPVPWDRNSLLTGATTRALGDRFEDRVGGRSLWVRLDNQINYSLFGEVTPRRTGTTIVRGDGDWLFESQYIDYAIKPGRESDDHLRQRAALIRRVQDKLARRGLPLVLVVAPNKAEVYPEHVPAGQWRQRSAAATTTDYERTRDFFQEAGVGFIDGPAAFLRWKQEGVPDLFARSGTHWSYMAGLRVWQDLRARLNTALARPVPEFRLQSARLGEPRTNDRDLLDLLNLLVTAPYEHPLPYPEFAPADRPDAELPRLLWVHDSFGWVMIELLYAARAGRPAESLYYFETCMRIPGATPTGRDLKAVDWPSYLGEFDGIVVVWTEIASEFNGWGFFEAVDRGLD